jgi:hypothetical protein
MPHVHAEARRRQDAGSGLGPLDERDGVVEVRLQVSPFRVRKTREAVQVEMRHRHHSFVPVSDRERRARHGRGHSERATRSPDERRLSGTKLARHGHDIARTQLATEPCGDGFRLLR